MKNISERDLTRNFLNRIIKEDKNYYEENDHDGHTALQSDEHGVVSPEELYNHFDLDNDGNVTTQEYADHIDFHAAHPETLDRYRELSSASCETVPCKTSYDSCGSYCLSDPESMKSMLQPILTATGATCHTSAMQSVIDVLKCMKECGLL